jgi:hypothetical protein
MKPRALVFLMVATCFVLIAAVAVEGWHLRVRSLPALGKHANLNYRTKPDYALLPESEASNYAKLFSPSPDSDMQSWEPTVSEIGALEANLVQVSSLRENVPAASRHIDNPEGYFRQYVAVIQHGKKLIFVNALCQIPADDSNEWRRHIELAADGGSCYWHAWYDPASRQFSDLRINGVG